MSAANPILAPTTAANTAFPAGGLNTNEADQIYIMISGNALGAAETIKVYTLDSGGVQRVILNPATGLQYTLDNSGNQALVLPAGPLYSFAKTATASTVGLDYSIKPRIGGGAS